MISPRGARINILALRQVIERGGTMCPQQFDEEVLLRTQRFEVVRLQQPTTTGQLRPREVVRHPGAVVILPLVDEATVCLIRNFRPAIGQWLIELPAGTLEKSEQPLATAERELVEETGYRAEKLECLQSFYTSPGILDEQMTLVLATGLTPGDPEREAGEQIENLVVSWQDAIEMVMSGQIRDGKTLAGLLYYDRARVRFDPPPDRAGLR